MRCAQHAVNRGSREDALEWYAMLGTLPFAKPQDRDRYLAQTLYEMGRLEESRGRPDEAKQHYRKAMALEDGDMRYRTRARDALESIEYFE